MAEQISVEIKTNAAEFLADIAKMKGALTGLGAAAKNLNTPLTNMSKNATKSFASMAAGASRLQMTFRSLGQTIGSAFGGGGIGQALSGAGTAFGAALTLDVIGAARGFFDIIRGAVELFKDGVEFAGKSLIESERIAFGYKATYGEKVGAAEIADAARMAKFTPYGKVEAAKILQHSYSGYSDFDKQRFLALRGDVRGRGGNEEAIDTFAQSIRARGGAMRRGLDTALSQIGGPGTKESREKEFYGEIMKMRGINEKEARKVVGAGTAEGLIGQMTEALMRMDKNINKNAGKSPDAQGNYVGQTGKELRGTLGGQLHLLEELPNDIFASLLNSPALPKLEEKITELLDAFDPASDKLSGLQDSFSGLFTSIGNCIGHVIDIIKDPENIKKMTELVDWFSIMIGNIAAGKGPIVEFAYAIKFLVDLLILSYKTTIGALLHPIETAKDIISGQAAKNVAAIFEDVDSMRKAGIVSDLAKTTDIPLALDMLKDKNPKPLDTTPLQYQHKERDYTQQDITIGDIVIHAGDTKDPNELGKKVAEAVQQHITKALESARQSSGSGR